MTKTRADFQPEISPMEETLEQVKITLRQHFEIKDWEGVWILSWLQRWLIISQVKCCGYDSLGQAVQVGLSF